MTTMPWRRPRTDPFAELCRDYPAEELLVDAGDPLGWERADCCIARAAFRVLLPTGAGRPRRAELRLCGHHYRRSADALTRLDAAVYDETNRLTASR